MATSANGEAQPQNNTAPAPFNPALAYDQEALTKVILERYSEPEKKGMTSTSTAADADTETATDDQTPESVSDDQTEQRPADEAHSQSQETESEAEAQAQADEQDDTQDDGDSRGVQRRIDRLTAQKKELAEKATSLERELAAAKARAAELEQRGAVRPLSTESNPFADVSSMDVLEQERAAAKQFKRWCERNPDGGVLNGREYTAEQVTDLKYKLEDAIEEHIPNRARFLETHHQIRPIAEKEYPWWKDPSSLEYTQAQTILRIMPQLTQLPQYQILIGDLFEGRKVREARAAAAKKPAVAKPAVRPAPRQPGLPSTAASRSDPAAQSKVEARKRFLANGGREADLADVLKGMKLYGS